MISRRRRFQPDIKRNQSFTLNITSMTDMFTILLVFLLQTFNSSELQIDPVEGVRLPASNTELNPVSAIKISLSQKELKMDQLHLADVRNSDIESSLLDAHDPSFIKPLFNELQKLNAAKDKNAALGRILLQADQDLPYGLLRKVMYTASQAGFPNLKLVTVAGE